MWKYTTSLVCGIVIGVVIDRVAQYIKINRQLKYSKVLEECFGEPMYTNTFTLSDVVNWSKAREEQIKSGNKIAVVKASPEKIKEFVNDLEIGKGVDNYLIIALVSENNKEIVESMLVKYEKLDKPLEEQLNKGNGSMVIEG